MSDARKIPGHKKKYKYIGKAFTKASIGHHNGHQPEIQIASATEATGVWYLTDKMWILNANYLTTGTALYWDRYIKQDGAWKIRETRYERLYEMGKVLDEAPNLASHYLATHGGDVPS